jgi:hypothetical protein
MTEQLTGYEASSVAEIEAILDASPADADTVYLDTIAYSERAIAAVAAKRAGSGGGGSLPADWSVTGDSEITSSDEVTFLVQGGSGSGLEFDADTGARIRILQGAFDLLDVVSQQGNEMFGVGEIDVFITLGNGDDPGNLLVTPNDFSAQASAPLVQIGSGSGAKIFRSGQLKIQPSFDGDTLPTLDISARDGSPSLIVRGGGPTTEPDDSFFNAGDWALWFDSTDGAAKLMIKAKSDDGTVVTGNVALS